jgi:hypothetical protein
MCGLGANHDCTVIESMEMHWFEPYGWPASEFWKYTLDHTWMRPFREALVEDNERPARN